MRPRTIRTATGSVLGAIAAAGVVIGVTMLSGGTALADVPAPTPSTSSGNVDKDQKGACATAGLSGGVLFGGGGDVVDTEGSGNVYDGGDSDSKNDFLDVTINPGFTASGIVVKAGPNYHVYYGPFVGLETVTGMTGPPVPGDTTPTISHWFVCGGETPPTPTPSTTSEPPTTEPPTTEPPTTEPPTTEPPTTEPPTTEPPTTEPPSTTEAPTTPAVTTTPTLPTTGSSLSGILVIGASLFLGGIALLILLSARRRIEDNTVGIG